MLGWHQTWSTAFLSLHYFAQRGIRKNEMSQWALCANLPLFFFSFYGNRAMDELCYASKCEISLARVPDLKKDGGYPFSQHRPNEFCKSSLFQIFIEDYANINFNKWMTHTGMLFIINTALFHEKHKFKFFGIRWWREAVTCLFSIHNFHP